MDPSLFDIDMLENDIWYLLNLNTDNYCVILAVNFSSDLIALERGNENEQKGELYLFWDAFINKVFTKITIYYYKCKNCNTDFDFVDMCACGRSKNLTLKELQDCKYEK